MARNGSGLPAADPAAQQPERLAHRRLARDVRAGSRSRSPRRPRARARGTSRRSRGGRPAPGAAPARGGERSPRREDRDRGGRRSASSDDRVAVAHDARAARRPPTRARRGGRPSRTRFRSSARPRSAPCRSRPARAGSFGIGSCPHSGMPGPPFGPAFRSTSTESAVIPSAGSSIRAARSSMSSKTTAGPRCESSAGVAALRFRIAPFGASDCRAARRCALGRARQLERRR